MSQPAKFRRESSTGWLLAGLTSWILFPATAGCGGKSHDALAREYFSVTEWEERLPLIANPDAIRPKMESFYADWRKGDIEVESVRLHSDCTTNNACSAIVHLTGENRLGMRIKNSVIVEFADTNDGLKIDWEATAGWNDITAAAFAAQRPSTPVRFRVLAKLSDYYNYDVERLQEFLYSIQLRTDDLNGQLPHGYVEKNSFLGRSLFERLSDGQEHRVVLDLQYVGVGDVAKITDVLMIDSWKRQY